VWVLASVAAFPQNNTEPAKLRDLRRTYQRELNAATAPALQKYREALVFLERACAHQRDYTTAIAVRDERLRVEKQLNPDPRNPRSNDAVRPYVDGPLSLSAKDAAGSGGVAFNKEKDALEGWKNPGASARWTLPFPLKAGAYDVVLEMACAPGSGGKVTIKEDFHTLTREVAATKGWDDFASQVLGPLRIKANSTGVQVGALTVEGDGLFLLRAVKLIPISEE
jgi:hypothetical protein